MSKSMVVDDKGASLDLVPVRIGTLRPEDGLTFDLYIKVADKFLHYVRQDDAPSKDQLKRLKSKGVKKLFIPRVSEPKYLQYLDSGIDQLGSGKFNASQKAEMVTDVFTNTAQNAKEEIKNEVSYQQMETRVGKLLAALKADPEAMKAVLQSSGIAQDIFQHSSNISSLALNLAKRVKIKDERELLDLSVAALLHDIGKEELKIDFSVPREKMSVEQLSLYHTHPQKSVDLLQGKPFINPNIIQLILQHDEIGDGAGFPNKKRLNTLPLTQQVLNLCNEYDRICTAFKLSPQEAIKTFFVEKMGLFELPLLKAFQDSLKFG